MIPSTTAALAVVAVSARREPSAAMKANAKTTHAVGCAKVSAALKVNAKTTHAVGCANVYGHLWPYTRAHCLCTGGSIIRHHTRVHCHCTGGSLIRHHPPRDCSMCAMTTVVGGIPHITAPVN